MAENQTLLYDSFNRYYDRGLEAKNKGDLKTAGRNLLLAAETLNKLAALSSGELKTARQERVKRILDIVENMSQERQEKNGGGETSSVELKFAEPKEKLKFDDIIGLSDAKKAIHRMLINPLKNPDVYKKYKLSPGGYILLEGPPGTGKTTFAKAAACELSVPFVSVDTNSLVDSYIGKTGKNIDKMFSDAREMIKKDGVPVVLFLDEFDAIAKKRGSDNKTADEAVPTLIRQMDGFDTDNENLVILASTNLKENIDSAVLSRFRNKIFIPLPDANDREKLFALKLKGKISGLDFAQLDLNTAASVSENFSGRDVAQVCDELKNVLAERDAGLGSFDSPLNEVFLNLVSVKQKEL